MRVGPEEYAALPLRAHALLADAPLHDVWALDLPGGGPGRSVADVRQLLEREPIAEAGGAVRLLFGLRRGLGRVFGWDAEGAAPGPPDASSYVHRLSAADRAASLVEPGRREGLFRTLFVTERESIAEVRNATVHAFLVYALSEREGGYRLHWAVHVKPVGRITAWYMRGIDPFRRWLVYPALLRRLRRAWARELGGRG